MSQPHTTILVVEDDTRIAEFICLVLEDDGYAPLWAKTGAAALQTIEETAIDLVILDRMLPDMDGDTICQVVKQRDDMFLPVLMITARTTLADRVSGLDAGADDYLVKPFHTEELMSRVRALLRIRAAERERTIAYRALDANNKALQEAYNQLRTTQAELAQAAHLAALGELVAGVAHELNNPLAVVLGNAELMHEIGSLDQRALNQIIEGAQRARHVLRSLMHYARRSNFEKSWYHLPLLVEQSLNLRGANLYAKGITIHIECQEHLPVVWLEGPRMQQVLLDILMNAEYALLRRPDPMIVIRMFVATRPVGLPPVLPDGALPAPVDGPDVLVVDVADNGPGLPDEVANNLFQPFISTKPAGSASGLSLSIAQDVLAQQGGTLLAHSIPDHGTTFRLVLSLHAQ